MKKLLAKGLLFALLMLPIPSASSVTYDDTIQSVVYIDTVDSLGNEFVGSGFLFSIDGLVLTNAHVIMDETTGEPNPYIVLCIVQDEYTEPSCVMSARVLAYDVDYDLAILYPAYQLDENWNEVGDFLDADTIMSMGWPYVDFADDTPSLGDDLTILGFPVASGSTTVVLTEGVVSAFSMLAEDVIWYFTTDATINPGNSGGPVYNEDERVVGVASAYSANELGGSYGYVISNDTILYWFLTLVDSGILNDAFVSEAFSNDYINTIDETYDVGNNGDVAIFNDVDFSDNNAEAISYLKTNDVIGGYPDGSFKPNNPINRAELLKILVEGAGYTPSETEFKNCFPDVKTDWYAKYACYAKEEGWVEGYPDGTFKPEQPVNKTEAIKMLVEVFGLDFIQPGAKVYEDVPTDQWYSVYLNTAYEWGLLEEDADSYYYPAHEITRGGVSENLYRLMVQL